MTLDEVVGVVCGCVELTTYPEADWWIELVESAVTK